MQNKRIAKSAVKAIKPKFISVKILNPIPCKIIRNKVERIRTVMANLIYFDLGILQQQKQKKYSRSFFFIEG